MLGMGCAGLFDEVAVAGCGLSGTVVWLWFGLDGVPLLVELHVSAAGE